MTGARRRHDAITAIALTAALLSGCSQQEAPVQPPEDVVADSEIYADQLRAVDGVSEVGFTVGGLDREHPEIWVSYVLVDAAEAESLEDLPDRLHEVTAPSSSRLVLNVRFPSTDELAVVVLRPALGLEEPAAILRSLGSVERVILDGETVSVILRPGFELSASAALIRDVAPLAELSSLLLSRGDIESSVVVTATTPSASLLTFLDSVGLDPRVDHLRLSYDDDVTLGTVIIETSDPAGLAAELDGFVADDDDVPIRYFVRSDVDEIEGCLGREPC